MKALKLALSALGAALVLAACGGGAGDQTTKASFTGLVSFGDSLSDVGSYKVGTVAALGGGKYTVNGPNALNWTEIVAKTYSLPAPCAAQTGLDGAAAQGFSVPVVNNATCFNYAQGGSRVTLQPGPGNKLLGGNNAILGQLTVPVRDQMTAHLAKVGGKYTGKELVTVMSGGNDIFIQGGAAGAASAGGVTAVQLAVVAGWSTGSDALAATLAAGGANAANAAGTQAVTAMGKAGAELAGYVKALVLANGAKTVVVVNLPNVAKTPFGISQGAQGQGFTELMVTTFNAQLKQGLADTNVVIADAFTESTTQAANPAPYGLTNVTKPACATTNALGGSALVCNASNTIAGDVSRYQYADDVHPTPFGYELLAKFVLSEMLKAGLL
jgi:outer membrane lipase/esterase